MHVPPDEDVPKLLTVEENTCMPTAKHDQLISVWCTLSGLGSSLLLLSSTLPETGEGGGGAGTQYVKLLKPALLLFCISRPTS